MAGIGILTEHGFKRHGKNQDNYRNLHNSGRDGTFYEFRRFVLGNVGIDEEQQYQYDYPHITFSINSSTQMSRREDFAKQIAAGSQVHRP